jgi:uncharacterized protein with PQ loop repeat
MDNCHESNEPIYAYVLGVFLCIGITASYIPQYISLLKNRSSRGISEMSLFILNISAACLTGNAFILNFWKFDCYNNCSFWQCSGNLLSFYQILCSWLCVLPIYFIYVHFKIKDSTRHILISAGYLITYILVVVLVVMVGLIYRHQDPIKTEFFLISANFFGVLAAITSCIVWVPQLIQLYKTKDQGSLSLTMFIMQIPGNVLIIGLQLLYNQEWSTWAAYVVQLIEQSLIVVLIFRAKKETKKVQRMIYDGLLNDDKYTIYGTNCDKNMTGDGPLTHSRYHNSVHKSSLLTPISQIDSFDDSSV